MSGEFARKIKYDLAFAVQEIKEMNNVLGKGVLVKPAQPNVEEISFAKTPAVSLEILAKIKLRYFRLNSAEARLVR